MSVPIHRLNSYQAKAWHIFSILGLLFLIPVMLAWFFSTHKTWLPGHSVNHGRLLNPPLSLQQLALDPAAAHHHWILLGVQQGVCDLWCQKKLYTMRQIQRALGKDQHRLVRVLLTAQNDPSAASLQPWLSASETLHWQVDPAVLARTLGQSAAWYVADPLGNIVLRYTASADPEAILDDLQYLMRVSNIG